MRYKIYCDRHDGQGLSQEGFPGCEYAYAEHLADAKQAAQLLAHDFPGVDWVVCEGEEEVYRSHEACVVVLNENSLGYTLPHGWIGILACSVIRGGHFPVNGPVKRLPSTAIRPATQADFDTYRVDYKGYVLCGARS